MYKININNNIKFNNIKIDQKQKLFTLIDGLSFSDSLDVNRAKIGLFKQLYNSLNYIMFLESNNIDLVIKGYNFRFVVNLLNKQIKQSIII